MNNWWAKNQVRTLYIETFQSVITYKVAYSNKTERKEDKKIITLNKLIAIINIKPLFFIS